MVYQVFYEKEALRELEKLHSSVSRRIIIKIESMAENPSSCDIKKLKSSDYYRLRVGDYRILFIFDSLIIRIFKIGHRKNIWLEKPS